MKIACFASFSGNGGVEKVLTHLLAGLHDAGHTVDLLLVKKRGRHVKDIPSTIRTIKLGPDHTVMCIGPLMRYLKRSKPDIVLAAKKRGNIAAVIGRGLAGSPVPLVLRIDTNLSAFLRRRSVAGRWLHTMLVKKFYPRADAVVAVSEGVAQDLRTIGRLSPERVKVIYNPVVSRELEDLATQSSGHPWLDGGPRSVPVVLGAGRLTEQKDFDTLLRAFALLRSRRPCRLVILGDGPREIVLEELARELGIRDDLSMPGFVENPFAFMARANVFALSSAWEGFGNVLAEAMALGTPVVSTDCPSGPREILEDGRYGPLVPVGDFQALAEALEKTLDAPPDPALLKERSLRFTIPVAVREHESLFGALVEETKGR